MEVCGHILWPAACCVQGEAQGTTCNSTAFLLTRQCSQVIVARDCWDRACAQVVWTHLPGWEFWVPVIWSGTIWEERSIEWGLFNTPSVLFTSMQWPLLLSQVHTTRLHGQAPVFTARVHRCKKHESWTRAMNTGSVYWASLASYRFLLWSVTLTLQLYGRIKCVIISLCFLLKSSTFLLLTHPDRGIHHFLMHVIKKLRDFGLNLDNVMEMQPWLLNCEMPLKFHCLWGYSIVRG